MMKRRFFPFRIAVDSFEKDGEKVLFYLKAREIFEVNFLESLFRAISNFEL